MRNLVIFAVALSCISAVRCISIVSREKRQNEQPVIIVDAGSHTRPFSPFLLGGVPMNGEKNVPEVHVPSNFGFTGFGSDFSRRLNAMLSGLQNQFDSLWKRFYERTDVIRPGIHGNRGSIFPPTFHNSTSTKKVVNGSVITVNETIDKHSDNDSMSFFHVKVIHVRPENPVVEPENDAEPDIDDGIEIPDRKATEMPSVHPEIPEVIEVHDREPLKPDHPDADKTNELEDNMP